MVESQDIVNWVYANADWLISFLIIFSFTIITIIYFNRKDKFEREPFLMIVLAVFLGLVSIIPSLILSLLMAALIPVSTAIVIAPIAEEIGKGIMVLLLARRKDFDGPLDGLVYGAMVGTGFAFGENLLYAYSAIVSDGVIAGILTASFRSVFQIIGHPLFTGVLGVGIGLHKVGLRNSWYPRLWYAMLLHALWNAVASLPGFIGLVGLVFLAIIFAAFVLRNELKLVTALDEDAYNRGYYEAKRQYYESLRNGSIINQTSQLQ